MPVSGKQKMTCLNLGPRYLTTTLLPSRAYRNTRQATQRSADNATLIDIHQLSIYT